MQELLPSISAPLPLGHLRTWIPGGNLGTAATISRMRDLVSQGKRDFRIRELVGKLVQPCPAKDYYCYAKAAHEFCRDRIKYVFDPNGVELIEEPWKIVESGVADCDSIVVLMSALCETMGFPCRFVTIKADKKRPGDFTHVFMEVNVPGKGWIGSDPTQPDKPFGWKPPAHFPRKDWPASNDENEPGRESDPMAGLGQLSPETEFEWIPGVQDTVGVKVGHKYSWREEPALITMKPEEMELDSFDAPRQHTVLPQMIEGEFFMAPKDDLLLEQETTAQPAMMQVQMRGMPDKNTWLFIGGALLFLWWLGKKK
jgi:hypothetical protein